MIKSYNNNIFQQERFLFELKQQLRQQLTQSNTVRAQEFSVLNLNNQECLDNQSFEWNTDHQSIFNIKEEEEELNQNYSLEIQPTGQRTTINIYNNGKASSIESGIQNNMIFQQKFQNNKIQHINGQIQSKNPIAQSIPCMKSQNIKSEVQDLDEQSDEYTTKKYIDSHTLNLLLKQKLMQSDSISNTEYSSTQTNNQKSQICQCSNETSQTQQNLFQIAQKKKIQKLKTKKQILLENTKQVILKCSVKGCEYKTIKRRLLLQHQRRQHKLLKIFRGDIKCPYCSSFFHIQQALDLHLAKIHNKNQ